MSINTAVIKVDPYLTFMFRTQGGSKAWSLRLNLRPEGGRPPDLVRQFLILRAAEDYECRTGKRAAASKVFFGLCAEIFDAVFPEPSDGLEDQIRRILKAYRAGLLQSRTSLFSDVGSAPPRAGALCEIVAMRRRPSLSVTELSNADGKSAFSA